jgi:tetratricopeptide (TPR) repeat protein
MSQVLSQSEERARAHRQLTEQAVQLALQSRWEEAVNINRQILATTPRDVSALNRLGKALSEMGSYADAKKAYSDALALDPNNAIAAKNLDRLAHLSDVTSVARPTDRIDPSLFIEETGKTGFTMLVDIAAPEVLAHETAGDQVDLHVEGRTLYVRNAAGETLGRIEPRLANRLINFMEGGNKYAAAITDIDPRLVRVIIREVYQHPSQLGRVSFPPAVGAEVVRPYIKDTILRYEREEEDEEEEYTEEEGEYTETEESAEDLAESEFEESDGRDMEES